MFKRNFTYGQVLVWAAIAALPAGLIIYLTADVFGKQASAPVNIMTIATLTISAVFAYYSGSVILRIARYCLIMEGLLAISLWAGVIVHVQLWRTLSDIKSTNAEKSLETAKQLKHRSDEADLAARERESKAKFLDSQTKLADSSRRLLNSMPASQRRHYVPPVLASKSGEDRSLIISQNPQPTPNAFIDQASIDMMSADEIKAAKELQNQKPMTESEARKHYANLLLVISIFDVFLGALGAIGLVILFKWDGNKNNLYDWVEVLPEENYPWLEKNHPQQYNLLMRKLYPTPSADDWKAQNEYGRIPTVHRLPEIESKRLEAPGK